MTSSTLAPKAQISDLVQHRSHLLKFAMLQLQDPAAAEDMVQDTLAAAIASLAGFEGRASLRTWLTKILLNKIADHLRISGRQVSIDAYDADGSQGGLEAFFKANGRYAEMPQTWSDPDHALTQNEFFEVLELCVSGLSQTAGRVFLLREMMGLSADEICKELGISESNCSVLLHRSRIRLRACLEKKWFGSEKSLTGRTSP